MKTVQIEFTEKELQYLTMGLASYIQDLKKRFVGCKKPLSDLSSEDIKKLEKFGYQERVKLLNRINAIRKDLSQSK